MREGASLVGASRRDREWGSATRRESNADTQPWFSGLGEIRLGEGREWRAVPISLWAFYDGEIKYMLMVETSLLTSPWVPRESSCKTGFEMLCFNMWFRKEPPGI